MAGLASLVRRMTEAGAPPEAIAVAMEEVDALVAQITDLSRTTQTVIDTRRAYDRDRKRAYRERQKSANVTGQSGDSPGTNEQSLSPQTPLTNNLLTLPKRVSKDTPKRVPTGDRKTAWQEGQHLPDDWMTWAQAELGWSRSQAAAEASRFIDSALANRRTYVDWKAAWRQWCRSPFQKTIGAKQEALTL